MTRVGLVAGGGILVIWLAGVAHATGLVTVPLLDLDQEGTVPQAYSGLLLLWAAAAGLAASRLGAQPRRPLMLVAGVFAFMSLDEVFRLHEALDSAVHFDWQVLYLPVFVVALAAWVGVARSLGREPLARLGWIGGAACWIVAQVLEVFQWEGRVRPGGIASGLSEEEVEEKLTEATYLVKMLPEELLEMCGSLLFALTLTHIVQRRLARAAAPTYLPEL